MSGWVFVLNTKFKHYEEQNSTMEPCSTSRTHNGLQTSELQYDWTKTKISVGIFLDTTFKVDLGKENLKE